MGYYLAGRSAQFAESQLRTTIRQPTYSYFTVTIACPEFTGNGLWPGSRAPTLVMLSWLCPADFARNVRVKTVPWPDIPLAPGGRVAFTRIVPFCSSSRWTNETG